MKAPIFRMTVIAVLLLMLNACGNKGDLYLPDKTSDNTTQKP